MRKFFHILFLVLMLGGIGHDLYLQVSSVVNNEQCVDIEGESEKESEEKSEKEIEKELEKMNSSYEYIALEDEIILSSSFSEHSLVFDVYLKITSPPPEV